jgi:RHH-type proline utilization regulon transcriptional repressor/proline dehydrogenase/delta 1-pyrroline-5-carboxylate dehydrogenase
MLNEYTNIPNLDFNDANTANKLHDALTAFEAKRATSPFVVKAIVSGSEISSKKIVLREDPSETALTVASVHYASVETAQSAILTTSKALFDWQHTPATVRVSWLLKLAELLKRDRYEFLTLLIREVGKSWPEANIEVSEAIDFCEYYARNAEKMFTPFLTQKVPGEKSYYHYQGRGVGVIISPWNFPFAIACGMVVSTLVTGNTAIFKPSEQASLIGYELAKRILEAGCPKDAFAFLPGQGEEIGPVLVNAPETALICFTGSRPVGLSIIENAAKLQPGQTQVKKVIAELSGKNAIIVDASADLNKAAELAALSAFGLAGQKCSACSRIIVLESVYGDFLKKLSEKAKAFTVGKGADPKTAVGPVVDADSFNRIQDIIALGKKSLTVLFEGSIDKNLKGHYVAPIVFSDVPEDSSLWKEEIFGPVVCTMKVATIGRALEVANNSTYALTGGIFSTTRPNIDLASKYFKAGNFYINRKITGAMVGRHPFGGYKLSGVGSKAGGPDYLLQFVDPYLITEAE